MSEIYSVKKHNVNLPHTAVVSIKIEVFPETANGECDGTTVNHTHLVDFVREKNFEDCLRMAKFKAEELVRELSVSKD